ncbi:MAG: HNH endonuclease [Alphaproteobacteria bacterium]
MTKHVTRTPGLSHARLRELLNYDPETGVFTWKVTTGNRVRAGARAGSVTDKGYRLIQIDGVRYQEHRLAFLYMTGAVPALDIDHINRIGSDNRWVNLRPATKTQNQGNVGLLKTNTSGVRGVYWDAKRSKFHARIRINDRSKHIGYFGSIHEAAAAYAAAAKKHFGADFAPTSKT